MTISKSGETYGNEQGFFPDMFDNYNSRISIDYTFSFDKSEENRRGWMSACIVIPTYNEALNIPNLIKKIFNSRQQKSYDMNKYHIQVLFVDDSSPDGTQEVIRRFQKNNHNIHLLSRKEKDGLGAAYIAGMKHALERLKPDVIFEMDADLSHNPKYIVPLLEEIRGGSDFVIGSRYVKGGSIPDNWGFKRKLLSKSANIYAKTLLDIDEVNDCTGGFRAIKASKLKEIDFDGLSSKGYVFQIALLDAMRINNASFKEVPIDFIDRTDGESKMGLSDMIEGGFLVLNMGIRNLFRPNKPVHTGKMPDKHERDDTHNAPRLVSSIDNYSLSSKNKGVDKLTIPKHKIVMK